MTKCAQCGAESGLEELRNVVSVCSDECREAWEVQFHLAAPTCWACRGAGRKPTVKPPEATEADKAAGILNIVVVMGPCEYCDGTGYAAR